MKKRFAFFRYVLFAAMAAVVIPFTSCDKDDDDYDRNAEMSAKLVGTWTLTSQIGYESIDGEREDYSAMYDISELKDVMVFSPDGTYVNSLGQIGRWSFLDDVLTVTIGEESYDVKILSVNYIDLAIQDYNTGTMEDGAAYESNFKYIYTRLVAEGEDGNGGEIGTSSDLIGTWILVAEKGYESLNGQTIQYNEEYSIMDMEDAIIFMQDGTCFDASGSTGTWSYSSGSLTTEFVDEVSNTTKVLTLNSTTLILQDKGTMTEDDFVFEWDMKLTYTKVTGLN